MLNVLVLYAYQKTYISKVWSCMVSEHNGVDDGLALGLFEALCDGPVAYRDGFVFYRVVQKKCNVTCHFAGDLVV